MKATAAVTTAPVSVTRDGAAQHVWRVSITIRTLIGFD